MTPKQINHLRISTERDIDQIVRACWPADWSSEPAPGEPRMATGCIHPVMLLQLDFTGRVYCGSCQHTLDNEDVAVRVDAWRAGKE